jgi:para-nitrobenzyl esterase
MMNRRSFLGLSGALASGLVPLQRGLAPQGPGATETMVEVESGRLRGARDGAVHVFKGVPYGASTAGPNRFQPARKPDGWRGIRDAASYGPRGYQPFRPMIPEIGDALTGSGPMSEECLRLNVWTPATGSGKRPVMVWFHGGGQRTGSGNSIFYDGSELARHHDVVVVTTTHRLNAFAYLWLAGVAGADQRFADCSNLGLRDLVLALEWIRTNIERFGGDPANVTIFGQSGGGGKTAMLTGFPAAKGLFHRAIIMSTLADTAITGLTPERAEEAAALLLKRLDIAPTNTAQLLTMAPERIVAALTGGGAAGGQAGSTGPAQDISLRFVPVVDGRTLPADPFRPASPLSATVPLMTGSNECEGIPYANPDDPYWSTEPSNDAALRGSVQQMLRVSAADAAEVVSVYRSHRPNHTAGDLAAIIAGDSSVLRQASYTIAEQKSEQGRAPVYLYRFNWRSPVRNGKLRSMHCMEIPFVFDHPDLVGFMTGMGEERHELARQMSGAWVAFARTGNPNHDGIPTWNAWDPRRWTTMVFDRDTVARDDPWGDERRALAMKGEREPLLPQR